MEIWQLSLIVGSIIASCIAFIWVALRVASSSKKGIGSYEDMAKRDVEHLFSDNFREELRNRGRLHFEKIIGENAMFLQQDLRLTTSQLNEFLKEEISKKLQHEFAKYEESITDAKNLAIDTITRTQSAMEQQHKQMSEQLAQEFADEKDRLIKHFEQNMANIINHYVMGAIGEQIDLNDQLEFILASLQENKDAIIRDISSGS